MKINFLRILIILVLIFVILTFFFALKKDNFYTTEDLVGNEINNFNLSSLNSSELIKRDDLRENNFTLINFFATWCSPCSKEHKYLINLQKKNKNIKILGINFKDKKNNALKFLDELGDPYYFVAKDVDGKESVKFGIFGIPESILINKELKILKKIIGPINENTFNQILEKTN